MLLFQTVLPVNNLSQYDFIQLAVKWFLGPKQSKYLKYEITLSTEPVTIPGKDSWIKFAALQGKQVTAVKFEKTEDDGTIWHTDFVLNQQEKRVSVRLEREFSENSAVLNKRYSLPSFIGLMIKNGYVSNDVSLPILSRAIPVTSDNIEEVISLINGQAKTRLPSVFISRTSAGDTPVNADILARKLAGAAHVFLPVEPELLKTIRKACGKRNPFSCAIGIYYPGAEYEKIRLKNQNQNKYTEAVFQKIVQYCCSREMNALYTWEGVEKEILYKLYNEKDKEERLSRSNALTSRYAVAINMLDTRLKLNNMQKMVAESQKTADESRKMADECQKIADENIALVESVDDEIANLKEQVKMLSSQNEALLAENHGLKKKLDNSKNVPVLYYGDEKGLFDGEIKEFVLGTLAESVKNLPKKSRRAAVLTDLINRNGGCSDRASEKAEMLVKTLKGYKTLTALQKRFLEKLGFVISRDGIHYKLTYYGDNRYRVILASTPSDIHSGENVAREIIRNMM